jgi:predicted transposase YdaD
LSPRDLRPASERKIEIAEHDRENTMPHVLSWVRIAREEGIEEGLEKGLEKGIEKGREEGIRDTIELSLRAKFGKAGLKLLPRLRRIRDIGQLREFQKAVIASDGIEQLAARLTKRRGPAKRS